MAREIDRRLFLKWGIGALFGLGTGGWLVTADEYQRPASGPYPLRGWFEGWFDELPLVGQIGDGLVPFLERVNNHPVLKEVTGLTFERLFTRSERVGYGDALADCIVDARSVLRRRFGEYAIEIELENSLHMAALAMASVFYEKVFTYAQIRQMGVKNVPNKHGTEYFLPRHVGNQVPAVFSWLPKETDAAMHTAGFGLLGHLKAYNEFAQLQMRIPRGALLMAQTGDDEEERARRLAMAGGVAWEIEETVQAFGEKLQGKAGADKLGLYDHALFDQVVGDLAVDQWAAQGYARMTVPLPSVARVEAGIDWLNRGQGFRLEW